MGNGTGREFCLCGYDIKYGSEFSCCAFGSLVGIGWLVGLATLAISYGCDCIHGWMDGRTDRMAWYGRNTHSASLIRKILESTQVDHGGHKEGYYM
jgi:hypothetical protein